MPLSKAEFAYRTLRQQILDAVLAPGEPLRHDRLRKDHGLGWTPLREALQRLEAERLVVAHPNRGFFVAGISEDELTDLLNTRLVLEEPMLLESIQRGGEDWEAGIVTAFHRLSRLSNVLQSPKLESLSDWDNRHRAFHAALLDGARSAWQKRLYHKVMDHLRRHQFHLTVSRVLQARDDNRDPDEVVLARLQSSMNMLSHQRLMNAVLARDEDQALQLLKMHVGETLGVYRASRIDTGSTNNAA
ncbi:GntR family transcriptional regulator [Roseibium sp. RKSG952]|uniref:GntR family transcriptional regulator n=1 Tax=Roseibium sp. RKSG952 TaxID=2529384 RepID=UPI0012BC7351|nr:GntR family transcriptional regulator [Roseibium sp. RKSG952]MTH97520.1 GntR family transcriptional regulator [Roseibium sp. RKSG952]